MKNERFGEGYSTEARYNTKAVVNETGFLPTHFGPGSADTALQCRIAPRAGNGSILSATSRLCAGFAIVLPLA